MTSTTQDGVNGTSYSGTQPASKVLSSASTSVHIETRLDLSLYFRLIRSFMKPLKPRLVSFKDVYPAGSPRLSKHPSSHYGINIVERSVQVANTPAYPLPQLDGATNTQTFWLYDCEPSLPSSPKRRITQHIYYFAGGGFKAPPSGEHWKMCAKMAKKLAPHDIAVTVVSYPLAPNSPAWASLPLLQAWLIHTITELQNSRSNETITLMGDSAGGNVAILLAFWVAKLVAKQKTGQIDSTDIDLGRLNHIVQISGAMDFTNTNPDIAVATKQDPVLTKELTDDAAERWTKDFPRNGFEGDIKGHPLLTPNRESDASWRALRDSGMRIDGMFGTADTLAPDCRVFMQRCEKEGVGGNWLVWDGQMHCFPMIQCYGVSEARAGLDWLCEQVMR